MIVGVIFAAVIGCCVLCCLIKCCCGGKGGDVEVSEGQAPLVANFDGSANWGGMSDEGGQGQDMNMNLNIFNGGVNGDG